MLADQSAEMNPDFLTEVVVYALSAGVLMMLIALAFVLARNIVKLVVERRRGLPFSRFRAKLVLALLGLTIVPSVLVLLVGGQLIRNSTGALVRRAGRRRAHVGERDRGRLLRRAPGRGGGARLAHRARAPARGAPVAAMWPAIRRVDRGATCERAGSHSSRSTACTAGAAAASRWSRSNPRSWRALKSRGSADRLAARIASGSSDVTAHDPLEAAANSSAPACSCETDRGDRSASSSPATCLSGDLAQHSRRITEAYEGYSQLLVMRPALEGVYLSIFLMMTLMILVSATWIGLYLAKRITRPIQVLAAGAREIGAGRLDHRIEPETRDEFGSLVEAFNSMAGELAASQRKLERSRLDLERKNVEVEERRRYIETVLERIATGVVSIGPTARSRRSTRAAMRLLGVDAGVDRPAGRRGLRPRRSAAAAADHPARAGRRRGTAAAQEIALARDGREVHLAAAATQLQREAQRAGRHGAGVRRRDAADPDAARGGVARRGAPARPRDQESADADPVERRAAAPAVRDGAAERPRADRGVHVDHRHGGRFAQGAGRRVRAVRAHAGAQGGADRPQRGADRNAGALQRPVQAHRAREAVRRSAAARCGSTPSRSAG